MLFYDDPLLGFVNKMFDDYSVCNYYNNLLGEMLKLKSDDVYEQKRISLAICFVRIISDKFYMSRKAVESYFSKNHKGLGNCVCMVESIKQNVKLFRALYRELWMNERKPFGFEVIDNRLGGMEARLDSFENTLQRYLAGVIQTIPELEAEAVHEITFKDLQFYNKIATKCFSIW